MELQSPSSSSPSLPHHTSSSIPSLPLDLTPSTPSSSPTRSTAAFTWSDLHALHKSSTVSITPSSLSSLVSFIALEGGKHGLTSSQLRHLVHRHVLAEKAAESSRVEGEGELDERVMEYWWSHLRQSRDLLFCYTEEQDEGEEQLPPLTSSLPSPSPVKPGKQAYTKKSVVQSQHSKSLQMTEDGLLFPPFTRHPLPATTLTLPLLTLTTQHPTLLISASPQLRAQYIGWVDSSLLQPPLLSSADQPPEDERGAWFWSAAYCLAETVGRSTYRGLYQSHLASLVAMTANNLHPLLLQLRMKGVLTTEVDKAKNRLYLKGWKERGEQCVSVMLEKKREHELWLASSRKKARSRSENALSTADDDQSLFTSFLTYNTPAPSGYTITLSHADQVYRVIHESGERGVTVNDLRGVLGSMGLKSFDRLLGAMNSWGIVSVADREGKSLSYRLMTKESYEAMMKRVGEDDKGRKAKKEVKEGERLEDDVMVIEPPSSASLPQFALRYSKLSTPQKPLQPPHQPNSDHDDSLPLSALVTQLTDISKPTTRAHPLLVYRRRQAVLDLLSSSPTGCLTSHSLIRSLSTLHPPAMTSKTSRAFLQAMEDDALIKLWVFTFPVPSGRATQQVVVVGKKGGEGEEAEEGKDRAYQVAVQYMSEFRKPYAYREGGTVKDEQAEEEKKAKDEPASDTEPEQDEGETDKEQSEAGDAEEEDGSGQDQSEGKKVKRSYRFVDNDRAIEGSRSLFGFMRPVLARAHYLHRALWTSYRDDKNPVVSSSPDSFLAFRYADLVRRLYLKDYLIVSGLSVKDVKEADFLNDALLLDVRLDQLPDAVQRLIDKREQRSHPRLKFLYRALDMLRQLHLIQPLLDGQHTKSTSSSLHFAYSLVPSLTVASHRFDFSSPSSLAAYWKKLRSDSTAPAQLYDRVAFGAEWGFSISLAQQLSELRYWRYHTTIRQSVAQQLIDFDEAHRASSPSSSCPWLPLSSMLRAMKVTTQVSYKMTMINVTTFYSRLYFPRLAQAHDEMEAYVEVRKGAMRPPGRPKKKGKRAVKDEEKEREEETKEDKQGVKEQPDDEMQATHASRVDVESGKEQSEEESTTPTTTPPSATRHVRPIEAVVGLTKRGLPRRRREKFNALWTDSEDTKLVQLYNEWLTEQREKGAEEGLPFAFTAPPHADINEDDGLPFTFPDFVSSSASFFAASFDTLLPLMWLEPPPARPTSTTPPASASSSVGPVSTPGRREEQVRAYRDFVVHQTPLPPSFDRQQAKAAFERGTEEKNDTTHDRVEVEDERKDNDILKYDDDERESTSASSLLTPFYTFAASRHSSRNAAQVEHRFSTFRSRLSLPIGLSSTIRSHPILSTPHTLRHLAPNPPLLALSTLLKVITLEPSSSYSPSLSHLATCCFTDQQVDEVFTVLHQDRWITRKKGDKRSWKVSQACHEILFRRKGDEAREEGEELRKAWQRLELGDEVRLDAPIERGVASVVMEAAGEGEVEVMKPLVEEGEEGEEVKEEESREEEEDEAEAMMEDAEEDERREAKSAEQSKDDKAEKERKVKVRKQERDELMKRMKSDPLHRLALRAALLDKGARQVALFSTHLALISPHQAPSPDPDAVMDVDEHKSERKAEVQSETKASAASEEVERDQSVATSSSSESGDDSILVHVVPEVDEVDSTDEESQEQASAASLEESIELAHRLVSTLAAVGSAGLTMKELSEGAGMMEDDDEWMESTDAMTAFSSPPAQSLFIRALRRAMNELLVLRVYGYAEERFIHSSFASCWAFLDSRSPQQRIEEDSEWRARCGKQLGEESKAADVASDGDAIGPPVTAVMAHPWRLMGGEVNEALWGDVYRQVQRSVKEWPGVKEERLMRMFPVLTPMELLHVLNTLLLDDAVVRRQCQGDGGAMVSYFPVLRSDD